MYPRVGAQAIAGKWTNALGTVWTLNDDGTFDVDLNHDGKRDAWGTFTVERDILTIAEIGGVAQKGCKGSGVYRFTRGRDIMRFHLVHDKCKLRVKNVMLLWHRK